VLINKQLSDKILTVEFQVGPFEFPPRLNGEVYANLLNDELPDLLDECHCNSSHIPGFNTMVLQCIIQLKLNKSLIEGILILGEDVAGQ
jgi:hypothetical protein